jgi:AraC-like DNA-binding protein
VTGHHQPVTWFRPVPPAPDLQTAVDCTWDATSEGHHDLVPDGCVELLWIAGRGVWVCGPDTKGWSFDLPRGTATTGIRFRPAAGGLALGFVAKELVDRRARLGEVSAGAVERRVDDELSNAGDAAERRHTLERFVRNRLRDAESEPMIVAAALLGRSRRPIGTLDRVADEFGVSSRQFRRRFVNSVGYSPAYFTRIARLQRFIRLAAAGRGGLAELAADAGYADQAHLHRDCTEIAGMTPRRLVSVLDRTSAIVHPFDGRSVQDRLASLASRS